MNIIVYALQSITSHKRYIGITNNLTRRLSEHQSGSTKGGQILGEFAVLHTEIHSNYPEARKREKFLKSGQGRQWLQIQYPQSRSAIGG